MSENLGTMKAKVIVFCLLVTIAVAQEYDEYQHQAPQQQHYHRPAPQRLQPGTGPVDTKPTPVPILKQINRHNEDGSYTYGYEGADGSFKIETKAQTGEVKGKYGYVDETGKVRVIEYGADKFGFQPAGEGITVPPPTLVDESRLREEAQQVDYEDENVPQKPYIARVANSRPSRPVQPRVQPQPQPQQQHYQDEYEQPQPQYQVQQQQPRRQQFVSSPVPQRAVIPGAAPVQGMTDVTYSAAQRPPRPDPEYVQRSNFGQLQQEYQANPIPRQHEEIPAPYSVQRQQVQYSAPRAAPVPGPSPPQQNYAPRPQQGRSTSVLDQLAKDYALPNSNSPPLHDISFGYY